MTPKRIAVVEDDADIRQLLHITLTAAGYETLTAGNGPEGLALIVSRPPDLVVLDLMLPGMSGTDICRELQRDPRTAGIPVIMLTARGEEVDRIVGLELGAEDYVVKPFSPRELVLRVRRILKRVGATEPDGPERVLRAEGLCLMPEEHRVSLDGEEAALTVTEFRLLAELLQSRGKVRTREQLLSRVWGYSFEGYARTVDTHVRRLRQKLGRYADHVETIRGVGYRFKEE